MRLSQLEYSALLAYAPRGDSEEIRHSRDIMLYLKTDAIVIDRATIDTAILMSEWVAKTILKNLATLDFASFFQHDTILVPTPKSSLMQRDTLWVPERIAKALVSVGLGKEVLPCLFRRTPVPKAARSPSHMRPTTAKHYETIGIRAGLSPPDEILLVDDIVTRGATLLGAANRLTDAFPNTRIRAFAAIRTISNSSEFDKIYDPCVGTITLRPQGDTLRRP